MKKLRLDLDALAVDSFDTGESEGARGTVKGHTGALCVEGNQSWDGQCGGGEGTYYTICTACLTHEPTCHRISQQPTWCGGATCVNTCGPEDTCYNTCAMSCDGGHTCNPYGCTLP